jgi:NADPH:quinone reductase-like Zn-dependent oxidoreductase
MFALTFAEFGPPEVLALGDSPEPHAQAGQVRIRVRAASVNPFDCKLRAGYMAEMIPTTFPAIPGVDAAGIVDEVGDGVDDLAIGDAVFGLGSATTAEYAVLNLAQRKPDSLSFEEAAALGNAVESAARCLDIIAVPPGSTVLVDGAAGGVGSSLIQLAVARGLTVIGTASEGNHEYLRSLGAFATTYGEGLAERVAALVDRVDGAVDLAGRGGVRDLVTITGDPAKVVTLADFTAYALGVNVGDGSQPRAAYAFGDVVKLIDQGRFSLPVERAFPLAEGADAHRLVDSGHVRGKVVLSMP